MIAGEQRGDELPFKTIGKAGKQVTIDGLKSEKGKTLNGRRAVVVRLDDPASTVAAPSSSGQQPQVEERRVQVRLLDDKKRFKPTKKILQIKVSNLIGPPDYLSELLGTTEVLPRVLGFLHWKDIATARGCCHQWLEATKNTLIPESRIEDRRGSCKVAKFYIKTNDHGQALE